MSASGGWRETSPTTSCCSTSSTASPAPCRSASAQATLIEASSYPPAATFHLACWLSSGIAQQYDRALLSLHRGRSATESSLLLTAGVGRPLDAAGVGAGLCRQALRCVRLPHGAQPASGLLRHSVFSAQSAVNLLAEVYFVRKLRQWQWQRQRQRQRHSCVLNMHWCFCRCGGVGGGMTATGSRIGCCAMGCRPSMLVHRQIGDCCDGAARATGTDAQRSAAIPAFQLCKSALSRHGQSFSGPSFTAVQLEQRCCAAQLLPQARVSETVACHVGISMSTG